MVKDKIDSDELKKYFDPFIFANLTNPVVTEIRLRQITIVFWDISGFSDACNKLQLGQEAIIAFLKEYFSIASEIIGKYAGVLDKFIGDGIMAYFGYPIENENHSEVAVNAALDLKDKFEEIRIRYQRRWYRFYGQDIEINVKCGIHSGFAFCGLIEAGNRNQITVIGNDVNLASRLEGNAEDNQILISPLLKNMVDEVFEFEEIKLPLEKRMKSYPDIDRVYAVIKRKSRLLSTSPVDKEAYKILAKDELMEFSFTKAKFHLSDKFYDHLRFESIFVKKIGKYYYELEVTITGAISKGFIDILVKDSVGHEDWFPDYKTFDADNYVGRLNLNNESYSDSLLIDTSKILREDWKVFVLIFEDSEKDIHGNNRKLVAGAEIFISPSGI